MTSYKAMTDTSIGISKLLSITSDDRYLSYLPIAHGMERWLGMVRLHFCFKSHYFFFGLYAFPPKPIFLNLELLSFFLNTKCVPFYSGKQVWYAEAITTFVADLNRCQPTLFLSVPRLWTKFQAGVFSKLPESKLNILLSIPLLNILIKKKLLKGLGLSKVRFAGSGSAPLPENLLKWYHNLGLQLNEGYGMTENFNYSHTAKPGQGRVGYVGHAYDDVVCRIAEDGEIQVKSPGMMMGYYKNPESTAETITADGFLRTGDKGSEDSQGRLKITGRTKEIFKTSKGKYVAPAPIENELIANHNVELACVGGKSQPQPFAILQLSEGPKKKAISSESERKALGKELVCKPASLVCLHASAC